MIERVLIQNFQAHEKLDVRFDPEITTIMGPSDTGKSALLRAIRWLCLNRPRGDGFIRVGSTGMSVKAKVDGVIVKRERGQSSNSYAIGKKEFKAFGNDVPPDIAEFLRVSDVNFQGQHDPQFWLSLSAPELARQLNKIVDLELIDKVTSSIAQRNRSLQVEVKLIEKRLASATERRDRLAYVEEASGDLDELERNEARIDDLHGRFDRLQSVYSRIGEARELAIRLQKCSVAGENAIDDGDLVVDLSDRLQNLQGLMELIIAARKLAGRGVPSISSLSIEKGKVEDCLRKKQRLNDLMVRVDDSLQELEAAERRLEKAEETYNKETEGQNCPICGTVLGKRDGRS